MRPYLFALLSALLIVTACTGVPNNNERWNDKSPRSKNAPKILATPGSYAGDADSGQGPYAEGGIANAKSVSSNLPPVKVAILLPLSGRGADIGDPMLKAAQLALFDLGAETFELIPKDTNGTAVGAAQAASEAVAEGAQLILGPLFSHSVKAVRPIAQRANINVIGFSTDWSQAGGNVYLMGFMPFTQVNHVTHYASSKGVNRIGLIVKNDAYGGAVERTFTNAAAQRGIQVPTIVRLSSGTLSAINIQTLRSANLNGVFIGLGGSEAANIGQALQQNGLLPSNIKRLGTGLWDDPMLAREPGMTGAWFAAVAPRARTGFERNYRDLYGSTPPRLASLAYDATALAAVLGKMGQRRANGIYIPAYSAQSISNPSGFTGIDGAFRFNNRGLVERQLSILEFRNQDIVEIQPAKIRF